MKPATFAKRAGLILMAAPSIFWLGVILAVGFEKPLIVHGVMLPIDNISPALTLMIMIGLPLVTFLICLKAMMMVEFNPIGEHLFIDISYRNNKALWLLMVYSLTSLIVTLSYGFFEHFNFYSRILS
jgi:hypothetical protein